MDRNMLYVIVLFQLLVKKENVRVLELAQVPSTNKFIHLALENHLSILAPHLQKEVSVALLPVRVVLLFHLFIDNLKEDGAEVLLAVRDKRVSDIIKSFFLVKRNVVRNDVLVLFWRVNLIIFNVFLCMIFFNLF